jgi:hypothetical protein
MIRLLSLFFTVNALKAAARFENAKMFSWMASEHHHVPRHIPLKERSLHKHVLKRSDRPSTDPKYRDHISNSVDIWSPCGLALSSRSMLDISARIGADVPHKSE